MRLRNEKFKESTNRKNQGGVEESKRNEQLRGVQGYLRVFCLRTFYAPLNPSAFVAKVV